MELTEMEVLEEAVKDYCDEKGLKFLKVCKTGTHFNAIDPSKTASNYEFSHIPVTVLCPTGS